MTFRTLALFAIGLGLASVASAQKARFVEPLGFQRPREIQFRSFDMIDAVGRRLAPQEKMELSNGRVVTAQEFYDSLNRIERGLNKVGHSLREASPNIVIGGNYAEELTIGKQVAEYARSVKAMPARTPPRRALLHSQLRSVALNARQEAATTKFGTAQLSEVATLLSQGTTLGNSPTTNYNWAFDKSFGDRSIGVRLKAGLGVKAHSVNSANPPSLKGATTTIVSTFSGGCQGTLLGTKFDILTCDCQVGSTSALGKVSTVWALYVAGFQVVSDAKIYDAGLTWKDGYSIPFQKQSQTMEFPVFGPFACSGFVGIEGEAGIKADLALNPIYAEAEVVPFVKAGVFGEVDAGLDAEVASAWGGLHADLTLVDDEFTLGANIGIVALPNNKLGWRDEVYVTNRLSLFTGSLSLVAHVFGPGGVKLQDFSYPFYTVPGYTDNRTLYQSGSTNPLNWVGN